MSRMEALRSYTDQRRVRGVRGRIEGLAEPGKLADIVVLSKDIMTCPDDEIPTARVDYTIVGGKVQYKRS